MRLLKKDEDISKRNAFREDLKKEYESHGCVKIEEDKKESEREIIFEANTEVDSGDESNLNLYQPSLLKEISEVVTTRISLNKTFDNRDLKTANYLCGNEDMKKTSSPVNNLSYADSWDTCTLSSICNSSIDICNSQLSILNKPVEEKDLNFSEIVHELVMKKYEVKFNYLTRKILMKHQGRDKSDEADSNIMNSQEIISKSISTGDISLLITPNLDDSEDTYGSKHSLQFQLNHNELDLGRASEELTFCHLNKSYSDVHLEAQRILLIASIKNKILYYMNKEINFNTKIAVDPKNKIATMHVQEIQFYINRVTSNQRLPFKRGYLCVLNHGKDVLSSKITEKACGSLNFKENFQFTNVLPEFCLYLEIYSLEFHKTRNNSRWKRYFKCKKVRKNAFTKVALCGKSCLKIEDLANKNSNFKLNPINFGSNFCENYSAQIHFTLELKTEVSGFLSVGLMNKSEIIWNQRWCVLQGSYLKYWNSYDVESNKPLGVVDLAEITEVKTKDDTVCHRLRTIILKQENCLKYFFCAYTAKDFCKWYNELSAVVRYFKHWNGTNLMTEM